MPRRHAATDPRADCPAGGAARGMAGRRRQEADQVVQGQELGRRSRLRQPDLACRRGGEPPSGPLRAMGRGSCVPLDAQNRWPHRERFLHGGEDRPRFCAGMITLIHGGESYLVDRAARDLLQPLRATLTLEFNYENIQADALGADAFAEKAGTLPFIDALRVLVLRDWGVLAGKRDKGAGAERAAAYLAGTPDSTHLVLLAHVLVARGNPSYKVVVAMERDKRARILRFEPPRRSDRAGWVRKLAEERGLTITPGAVRLLLERSQPDLRLLDQEIAKLALYGSPSTRIDEEALRALVSDSREEEIFALTDALGSARPGEVAGVLQSLLDAGREPTWLLYTLVSHWRRLLQARAVRDRGGTVAELQAKLTDHPFVVEKAFRQAADYSAAELDRGFHQLLKLEEQIKLGELDARLAVEGFILEQVLGAAR